MPLHGLPGPALVYESLPVGQVTGLLWFGAPIALSGAMITTEDDDIRKYLAGARKPCALPVMAARRFAAPAPLATVVTGPARPPQSWCYVEVEAISAPYHLQFFHSSAARSAGE